MWREMEALIFLPSWSDVSWMSDEQALLAIERNTRELDEWTREYGHLFPGGNRVDPNKPEPRPCGRGPEVTLLVIKDLEARSAQGVVKYGETLRTFNGRSALVDSYQETLDLVQYLRQLIEEERSRIQGTETGRVSMTTFAEAFRPDKDAESIAQEAHRIVVGDRGESYGHPIFDMTRSADMMTALLRNKLRPGARLEAEDMGQAMICVKQSRHRNRPKRDNLTDTAGYALTLQMIAEWRTANPGVDPRDVFPG